MSFQLADGFTLFRLSDLLIWPHTAACRFSAPVRCSRFWWTNTQRLKFCYCSAPWALYCVLISVMSNLGAFTFWTIRFPLVRRWVSPLVCSHSAQWNLWRNLKMHDLWIWKQILLKLLEDVWGGAISSRTLKIGQVNQQVNCLKIKQKIFG